MNEPGYHLREIEKGKLGEFSKIKEEFQELEDAYEQNDRILMICECSDLIGAMKHFLAKHNISIFDLIKFNDKTESAFLAGKR